MEYLFSISAKNASKNRKIYIKTEWIGIKKSYKNYYACIVILKKNTYLRED